jgi:uroporphyrin-III C-methyltransferase/precorrin-2 dehydrogenase/sirohydrochlorin ferrochelatase
MSQYFSVALSIQGRRCLVVGGGSVAARKIEALCEAGAQVVIVAMRVSAETEAVALVRKLEVRRRAYAPADLDDAFLVITATNDPAVNARIAADARQRHVLVNAADDPASCDFIMPAVVRRGDVQVAVTTGAQSPALARHLRERLERAVPPAYGLLAEVLSAVRSEVRAAHRRVDPEAWQQAINDVALDLVRRGDVEKAKEYVRRALRVTPSPLVLEESERGGAANPQAETPAPRPLSAVPPRGRIVLVGAGPGDPGLLTIAGRDALAEADVVVYDRLVNPALLDWAPGPARLIYAGKSRGGAPMSQTEINRLLCDEAGNGAMVVRLKGGDPFVFGRGGEEALAAAAAGIPCTVIPGVSAAIAAPAAAGIPVTHRGLSSAFTVVTGHEDATKPGGAIDWAALARLGGTLVLLMGVETLAGVSERLLNAGLAPRTPAAVIESASNQDQRVVTGSLANIAERARQADIRAPATTVIGEVASLSERLVPWATDNQLVGVHDDT